MGVRKLVVSLFAISSALLALTTPASASPIPAHSVPNLYRCSESRSCDIKNADLHFVNYSSVCSYSDCNFVAAADWEKIALHIQPSANLLRGEYKAAHQTFSGGMHMPDLWSYWKLSGIDGAFATKVTTWSHTRGAVQNGVLHFGSMIAALNVRKNSALAIQLGVAETLVVTIDGFDPGGPLVVFKAKTVQATWAQWGSAVRAVWGVSTSTSPLTPCRARSVGRLNFDQSADPALYDHDHDHDHDHRGATDDHDNYRSEVLRLLQCQWWNRGHGE